MAVIYHERELAMPLDVLNFDPKILRQQTKPLADAVESLGIVPIPIADLDVHKRTEAAKYPGSFVFRHYKTLEGLALGGFLFGIGGAMLCAIMMGAAYMASEEHIMVCSLCGVSCHFALAITCIALAIVLCERAWKKPAQWIEGYGFGLHRIPTEISTLAWTVRRVVPNATIVIGTLVQHKVVLDPYLLMRLNDETIVLGIWDDRGIIRIAQQN
jgi:hypothetical protein